MEQPEPLMSVEAYHTQELRETKLLEPVWCDTDRAWLGPAYYFWERLEFARIWGEDGRKIKDSGGYSIYAADIDLTHNLDTCSNKEASDLFESTMDRAVARMQDVVGQKVDHLAAVEMALQEIMTVAEVQVITYCDIPQGTRWRATHPLYYKKRTQFAVLSKTAFSNFRHLEDGKEVP